MVVSGKRVFFIVLAICFVELSIGSPALGEDDIVASCRSLRSLSRLYMAYGEYSKALPFLEQALEKAKKTNAEDELAFCLLDMAYWKKNQEQLADAEKLCMSGLELQKKSLNENHPYIAEALRTLFSIYLEEGKLTQAEQTLEKAKDIMKNCNINNDFVMVPFEVDYAKLLVIQGNYEQAEQCYSNALSIANKVLGEEHLYNADVMENMAELYCKMGKYEQAEPLAKKALSLKEKTFGTKHPFITPILFTKAKIKLAKGDMANLMPSHSKIRSQVAMDESMILSLQETRLLTSN